MKPVDAPSAWSSHSDLDKKESDGRDPPQGVAPHAPLAPDKFYTLVGVDSIKTSVHVYLCLSLCEENGVDRCREIHARRINVL